MVLCCFQYAGDDDVFDEDEVRHLLVSVSDDDAGVQTELGYDADSEDTHPGDVRKGHSHKFTY